MNDAATQQELLKVEDWLMGILRFAVTLQDADRATVRMMAEEMDRLGSRIALSNFAFFARTTTEICDGIVGKENPDKLATLHRHLSNIDNDRLRRGLEAALGIERPVSKPCKSRSRRHQDLWKGLPSR